MARKPDTATALQQARITLQGIEAQVSELSATVAQVCSMA
jgi:hypothetical protein